MPTSTPTSERANPTEGDAHSDLSHKLRVKSIHQLVVNLVGDVRRDVADLALTAEGEEFPGASFRAKEAHDVHAYLGTLLDQLRAELVKAGDLLTRSNYPLD